VNEPQALAAQANGIRMVYRRWTSSPGAIRPTVVLLHGVLQTGDGMRHLAERLSGAGEVLVPDLRGRGGTDQPPAGYDPTTMAADVAALLDGLGVGGAVIVGRLHGGLVAYHLAVLRPALVLGLVLGDTTPEVSEERAARIQARLAKLPRQFADREEAERFYEEGLRLSPERAQHDLPSDLVRAPDGSYRWRHNLNIVARIEAESMPRSDWEMLAQVRCPTLVLRGQRGEISQATADCMLQTLSAGRWQTILGAGHDVFLGPGAEQTLAAIQLFLHGLSNA
jgi:pimeloyl-ACP methyl ester carboxylesterase